MGSVKHKFVSLKSDGADTSLVRPSDWNDVHEVLKQTEIDFTVASTQGEFTITDSDVTSSSIISAEISYDQPTGKDSDEMEFDSIEIRAGQVSTGSFKLNLCSRTGSLFGKFKINYIIGE